MDSMASMQVDENIQNESPLDWPFTWQSYCTGPCVLASTIVLQVLTIYVSFKIIDGAMKGSRSHVGDKHIFLAAAQLSRVPYSVVVVAISVYDLANHYSAMYDHFVDWTSPTAELSVLVTIGFYIVDTFVIALGRHLHGVQSKLFLFHHALMLLLYCSVYATGHGYAYGSVFLLVEAFIPQITVQLLGIGLRLGVRKTLAFNVNTAVMVHLFHLRHAFECYLGLVAYWNWDSVVTRMSPVAAACFLCHLGCMLAFVTPYWIYHFTTGSIKEVLDRRSRVVDNGAKHD